MEKKKLNSKWITKSSSNRLYQIPVPIIGLTGGISTGKSTVAKLFRELDFPIIDADELVKNIYKKSDVIDFIKTNFSEVMENDIINLKKLRKIAFSDALILEKIEKVIYQHLPNEFLKKYQELASPAFIIYDVPLLFEKKLNLLVDIAICVYTTREIQIDRLMKRDNIDLVSATEILNHQLNIESKKNLATLVIDNSTTLADLKTNFESVLKELDGNI